MPSAKDGSKHASFGRAKLHDDMNEDRRSHASPKSMEAPKKESKGEAAPKPKGESEGGGESENMEAMPETPTPIEQHVSQHGPADEVHHRIGNDGQHHVLSHHGGQTHKSVHPTHEAAHHHIGAAMGVMPGATADGGGMSPAAPEPAAAGGIPGMM